MNSKEKELKDSSPHQALEEAGVGYDPTVQHLDLTKEEKRRTTALMMAIQAYQNLIIKDADYLREAANMAQRGTGPQIQPATMNAMVEAAIQFDLFIVSGGFLPNEHVRAACALSSPDDEGDPENLTVNESPGA